MIERVNRPLLLGVADAIPMRSIDVVDAADSTELFKILQIQGIVWKWVVVVEDYSIFIICFSYYLASLPIDHLTALNVEGRNEITNIHCKWVAPWLRVRRVQRIVELWDEIPSIQLNGDQENWETSE